jgi:hypothetical protein
MSGPPSKADILSRPSEVGFVPEPDVLRHSDYVERWTIDEFDQAHQCCEFPE